MTYKKLLRKSRPQAGPISRDTPIIPLFATSCVMQAFFERCLYKAKHGDFIAITGHPGDLIEAPALFLKLAQTLVLQKTHMAPTGLERSTVLQAAEETWNALYVPHAERLPVGTQEWMVEGNLQHVSLMMLEYPANKNIDLQKTIRASLQKKCGDVLQYPSWGERKEDHAQGIAMAAKLADKYYGVKISQNKSMIKQLQSNSWKSMTHMIAVIMELAKQQVHSFVI